MMGLQEYKQHLYVHRAAVCAKFLRAQSFKSFAQLRTWTLCTVHVSMLAHWVRLPKGRGTGGVVSAISQGSLLARPEVRSFKESVPLMTTQQHAVRVGEGWVQGVMMGEGHCEGIG